MAKRFVTLKQLSAKLGVKANTLYKWAREGKLEYRKERNRILVKDVERDELLLQRVCKECRKHFLTMYPHQKFHNRRCATRHNVREWYRKKRGIANDI